MTCTRIWCIRPVRNLSSKTDTFLPTCSTNAQWSTAARGTSPPPPRPPASASLTSTILERPLRLTMRSRHSDVCGGIDRRQ
eukprot:1195388-Prorocentrum_minimum.AAC.3